MLTIWYIFSGKVETTSGTYKFKMQVQNESSLDISDSQETSSQLTPSKILPEEAEEEERTEETNDSEQPQSD